MHVRLPLLSLFVCSSLAASPARDDVALERAVLGELNRMRADPAAYGRELEPMRAQFRGNLIVRGGGRPAVETLEGLPALDECIAALEGTAGPLAPLRQLTADAGLAIAAREHVLDEGKSGSVGHKGTDGSNSFQRISRHGRSHGLSGEVIDYGWSDAKDIVVDLCIDDGIKNRGHRNAILQPLYAQAGVACGPHTRYGVMCVVEMAERFSDGAGDALAMGGAR